MRSSRSRRWISAGGAAVLALSLVGCGDDDEEAGGEEASGEVEITAVDYAFQDVPSRVSPGTKLTLTNASSAELHELVALRLPDGEGRSLSELVALPEEELEALFTGEPATVLLAPPGGAQIDAVGDGTLTESGRYVLVCFIPTGADPQAYLAAAQAATDGPPQVEGGPPHFTQGMYAEVTVS